MTISLPPAMLREVAAVSKAEHRTHSELVREALRTYLYGRYPVVSATKAELAAIARGRAEIKKGNFVTFEQLANDLDSTNRAPRPKRTHKASH
jgi:predicted transcriptional regulator